MSKDMSKIYTFMLKSSQYNAEEFGSGTGPIFFDHDGP